MSSFKRANDAGIFTLTHEASVQQQVSYDVEAFDNTAYGKHMMDVMAKWLGNSGMWQPFVGHLTSTTHNQWVDGEVAQAKARYPSLKMATDRQEEQENQQIAHDKTLELLKTYPDLKAVMGSAMTTVPGAGQAITEKGLIGKVAAFGTCLPSVAGDYIQSGAVVSIHFWVPADAGYVTARAAYELLKGNKVTEGMDMGRPGYEKVTIKNNPSGVPVIYGAAWVDVNKDNLKDWMTPTASTSCRSAPLPSNCGLIGVRILVRISGQPFFFPGEKHGRRVPRGTPNLKGVRRSTGTQRGEPHHRHRGSALPRR